MASSNNSANSNSSNNAKEQLLVCWLEPQSDAGKVSAIPASWIVSTVSGDGRSPNSVVRCRWPRTKRLYRARIVSSADQQAKSVQDETGDEEEEEIANESATEKRTPKDEPAPVDDPVMVTSANIMVKEEVKPSRSSQSQQNVSTATAPIVQTSAPVQHNVPITPAAPVAPMPTIDAATIAQALLPTLKKMFNSELSKLSTDIQANFDIIGHKISALDGTVKCIKTRVDRMETLLNTAAQELGDNQPSATTTTTSISSLGLSANSVRGSSMSNDILTGAARNSTGIQNNGGANSGFYAQQLQQNRNSAISNALNRYATTTMNSASSRNLASVAPQAFNAQGQQQRRPPPTSARPGGQQSQSLNTTPIGSRPAVNAALAVFARQAQNAMISQQTGQRPQMPGNSASAPSSSSKRRRTTPTVNPPLPKAVIITAPNGIDIYLGGDKNYKMPLVMYKDALKNCTRPIATYMVMALIRRYLTPDEMSRTWLTEQQLLGKKDGMLLDQSLLTALKKQALMQFPGSGIDDRLLVRKLYDVFHGIRRQMRKKRREAGDLGGQAGLLGNYDNELGGDDLGGLGSNMGDDDSGSGNEHDDGMDDDSHHMEQGSGGFDDHVHDYDGDDYDQEDAGQLGDNNGDAQQQDDDEDGGGLMGDGILNGDEDLEEMAAKQAAFWAGTDEGY